MIELSLCKLPSGLMTCKNCLNGKHRLKKDGTLMNRRKNSPYYDPEEAKEWT